MSVVINEGTQSTIKTTDSSGHIQHVRADGGTVGTMTNLGSITNVGQIHNAGTLQAGSVITIGMRHSDEFATVVSTGTSEVGTIRAAVSGSVIYVTGAVISVQAASNVVFGNGGTSLPILGTLFFGGSGGAVAMPFDPPIRTSSGSALVYKQSANTGMTMTVVGYID